VQVNVHAGPHAAPYYPNKLFQFAGRMMEYESLGSLDLRRLPVPGGRAQVKSRTAFSPSYNIVPGNDVIFYIFMLYLYVCDRLCGLVVRVSGYRSRGPGLDSRRFHIF
jgi:hypothetical protein